ncbi:MAG: FecR domain-containing protein [Phycisphaerae bacterium]|nr:FecR domain-containing protein [Phycisphaerae bacterium]
MKDKHEQSSGNDRSGSIGDLNIERLIGRAYEPETPDKDFAERVVSDMLSAARNEAARRARRQRTLKLLGRGLVRWGPAAAAAAILIAFLVSRITTEEPRPAARRPERVSAAAPLPAPRDFPANPAMVARMLTARSRPPSRAGKPLAVGAVIRTQPRQRRRVVLTDGSVLYVNQDTEVVVTGRRRLSLRTGEVYVEVSPQAADLVGQRATFVIHTRTREVVAVGTHLAVNVSRGKTAVMVTQGKARVSGLGGLLHAGQQLRGGDDTPTALPRATYVLDWTKDLMAAAQSPLVPRSRHAGGALVAVDPSGQEMKLSLRKFHVDVHIEDGFARTTIDQTYFNHTQRRLEGTFYFPLPPDASLSRLAMYVEGKLNEGGMVERDRARAVYESIVYKMQDPALLEWVDGTTFKMRVFPLFGRREKRIILSYTQKLPVLYGRTAYRFPAGHSMQNVGKWSFRALVKGGAATPWQCDSHKLTEATKGDDLILTARAENIKPDTDVVLDLMDAAGEAGRGGAVFSSAAHEASTYLMLRYRPNLPAVGRRQKRHWVFLFESSADRDPLLARAQIEVVRGILQSAEHDDTFALVTAGTRAKVFSIGSQGPIPASPPNVVAAMDFLENTHLIGALDLGQALAVAGELCKSGDNAHLVHVGTGLPVLGARDQKPLLGRLPAGARYVGVGVGKRWSRSFMKAAAAATGGYYTQINPDENISWRAFELVSTLNTPRLLNVRVDIAPPWTGGEFLCHGDSAAHGEQICAILRVAEGHDLPRTVTVTGLVDGKEWSATAAVRNVAPKAGYLPRIWARLEIDRLLAEDPQKNHKRIVKLSKAMYVMSPFTSLLVLENEAMYKRYKVDRGRKDHWALYRCPEKIPVVHEPLPTAPATRAAKKKPRTKTPWQKGVLETILVRVTAPFLQAAHGAKPNFAIYAYAQNAWQIAVYPPRWAWRLALYPPRITLYNGQRAYVSNYVIDRSGSMFSYGIVPPVRNGEFYVMGDVASPGVYSLTGRITPKQALAVGGRIPDTTVPYLYVMRHKGSLSRFGRVITRGNKVTQSRIIRRELRFFPQQDTSLDDVQVKFLIQATQAHALSRTLTPPRITLYNGQPDPRVVGTQYGKNGTPNLSVYPFWVEALAGHFNSEDGIGGWGYRPSYHVGGGGDRRFYSIDTLIYIPDGGTLLLGGLNRGWETGREIGVPLLSKVPILNRLFTNRGIARDDETLLILVTPRIIIQREQGERFPGGDARPTTSRSFGTPSYDEILRILRTRIEPRGLESVKWVDQGRVRRSEGSRWQAWNARRREKRWWTELSYPRDRREITARRTNIARRDDHKAKDDPYLYVPAALVRNNVLYSRPRFTGQREYFTNLTVYAPGLNTTTADVLAVLEAQAPEGARPKRGSVDPEARKLIDAARAPGWQALSLGAESEEGLVITFDGTGRYAYSRICAGGLAERVICDGRRLLHLYDQIGLGTVREVSRFHRAELIDLVPWLVLPADDLAVGAKLTLRDQRTVTVTPLGAKDRKAEDGKPAAYVEIRLVFAGQGRLAERQVVLMPKGKIIGRITCGADGLVKVLSGDQKVLSERKYNVRPAAAPNLKPDLSKFVILPMPRRTLQHFERTRKLNKDRCANWSEADALAYIAATAAPGQRRYLWGKEGVIERRFINKGDRRMGFYVLLAEQNRWPALPQFSHSYSLGTYLTALAKTAKTGSYEPVGDVGKGFIGRLGGFRDLWHRAKSSKMHQNTPQAVKARDAWRDDVLAYVRGSKPDLFAWALLSEGQRLAGKWKDADGAAGALDSYARYPALRYVARYESARALCTSNKGEFVRQGRERFKKLYSETLADGLLGAFDQSFYHATRGHGWKKLIRNAAGELVKKNARFAAVVLARQCQQVGDSELGREVLTMALTGAPGKQELPLKLAAFAHYRRGNHWADADRMLWELLADKRLAKIPSLWRAAADVAFKRGRTASAVQRLDRALDIEYRRLPQKVNVRAVRAAFGHLMGEYAKLCQAVATLQDEPPKKVLAGLVRAADRWRALDVDPAPACHGAAKALRRLGANELAWDYLTTPLASKPNEAGPWAALAAQLAGEGDVALADRAYAAAFDIEPTNAQILWDRAQLLSRYGRAEQAARIYRRISEGSWQPKHQSIKNRAAQALKDLKR